MATIPLGPIEPYNPESGAHIVRYFPVDSAATFKRGAVVVLDADGEVAEGGADPSNIWGIADADAADKDADNRIPVILPGPDAWFIANLSGTSVTAQTDLGKAYGLVKTGNNWHVDKTDAVNTRVVIRDFDRRDAIGATNGRVLFSFRSASVAPTAGL